MRHVTKLVEDPIERQRQGALAADSVARMHQGESWRGYLAAIKEALPVAHEIYPSTTCQTPPATFCDFWTRARGPLEPVGYLRHVLIRPIVEGMEPGMDWAMAETVLRNSWESVETGIGNKPALLSTLLHYLDGDSILYVDSGEGFSDHQYARQAVRLTADEFELTFDLSQFRSVRAVRWHPAMNHLCQVRLDAITFLDAAKQTHQVHPSTAESNGQRLDDGTVGFKTLNPLFAIPAPGNSVTAVTLRGVWHHEQMLESMAYQDKALSEMQIKLAEAEAKLRAMETSRLWRMLSPARKLARTLRLAS